MHPLPAPAPRCACCPDSPPSPSLFGLLPRPVPSQPPRILQVPLSVTDRPPESASLAQHVALPEAESCALLWTSPRAEPSSPAHVHLWLRGLVPCSPALSALWLASPGHAGLGHCPALPQAATAMPGDFLTLPFAYFLCGPGRRRCAVQPPSPTEPSVLRPSWSRATLVSHIDRSLVTSLLPPSGPSRQRPRPQQTLAPQSSSHHTPRLVCFSCSLFALESRWLGHLLCPETPRSLTLEPLLCAGHLPALHLHAALSRVWSLSSLRSLPLIQTRCLQGRPLLLSPGFACCPWPVNSRLCRHRRLSLTDTTELMCPKLGSGCAHSLLSLGPLSLETPRSSTR